MCTLTTDRFNGTILTVNGKEVDISAGKYVNNL